MNLKKFFRILFCFILVILTVFYIVYRIAFTIPTTLGAVSIIFAILILFVEIWDAVDFIIYTIGILKTQKTKPEIPKLSKVPDIDILIATINESSNILKNTITSCQNLKYPDKSKIHIYVCDDGNRKEIKELAEFLDVGYIARITNKDAKAGNYNNALKYCKSEYIATFDADMAPTSNFLLKALPFLTESKDNIGFVQLPQSFKNPDIFQYRFKLEHDIPYEQDYFYNRIQLAKNNSNSCIYCGTNTIFLKQALIKSGGFAKNSISEDIATGMQIEANGYKGIAIDNVESYGICVNDLESFLKQRSRWSRGCIQILKNHHIFKNKGLSFRQKLEYFSCISYWFFGFRRMIYLLAPLLFSIFGIIIIDCDLYVFLAIWLPSFILKRFALDMLEGKRRSSTWTCIYETILAPFLFKEVFKELIGFGSTKFEVTPKTSVSNKMSKSNKKLLLNHILILLLNITGLIMCLIKIPNNNISIFILSLVWIISNIFYLIISIIFDLSFKKRNITDFVPNKISKYSLISVIKIFINVFKK